jgi:thioredoxin-like negative regulator of GroEL
MTPVRPRAISKPVFAMSKVAPTIFEGRALVGTVEAGREGALVSAHRISAVPTFVFFRSGQEVSRQVGATTYEDLAGQLQALVSSS